MTRYNSC